MSGTPLPDEALAETLRVYEECGRNQCQAAERLGIHRSSLQARLRTAERRAAKRGETASPPLPAPVPPGSIVTRNSAAYDKDGNLERQWVGTRPDAGEPHAVPDGHVVKGESALLDSEGRVLVRWVKTSAQEKRTEALADALKKTFDAYTGKAPAIAKPRYAEDDLLTVYPVPDLHLGMYSWPLETGESYDVEIATKMASEAMGLLIGQARPSKHAVILGLGDYFHANDAKSVTPASGHKLDVDGRWPKVFEAGAHLATGFVDTAARVHENVEVVFLPGNHDPDAAMSLTVALSLFYSRTTRISVHQEPGIAWYRRHGKVLIGATHGHTMKPDQMAMMLAADRPADWGRTSYRHFFFGHVHHESAKEVGAVRVESLSTPAPRDAYAAAGGWRSTRALQAITFHRERGEIGRHRINLPVTRPRIRVKAT